MRIGAAELLVVFIVALIVIGPDRLPEYARKFGKALAAFKKASEEATEDIKKSVVEPLEEAQKPLREAAEPINELNASVEKNLKDVQKSINNIGKTERKTGSGGAAGAKSAETEAKATEQPEATQEITLREENGTKAAEETEMLTETAADTAGLTEANTTETNAIETNKSYTKLEGDVL